MSLKVAMDTFFEKLLSHWERQFQSLPQIPVDEEVDLDFYVSIDEDDDLATWRPKLIVHPLNLEELEEVIGLQLHPSIREYLSTYYFAAVGGTIRSYSLELDPILPGMEYEQIAERVGGYRAAREESGLSHIQIGMEVNGLMVVVSNQTGAVDLEDSERGLFEPLAKNLSHLFEQLDPT